MSTESALKKCSCGYTKDDNLVVPKTRYNKMGLLWLSMAYSAKPIEVVFQCEKCGEIIDRSDDPSVIEKYRYNSDIFHE